jgi:hypothetical protein
VSTEQLVEITGEVVERKNFLRRAAGASLGAFLGVMGFPQAAHAIYTHGCGLCDSPGSCPPSMQCAWCWTGDCHNHGGVNRRHYCCEGYVVGGSGCNGQCHGNQVCSYYTGLFAC